MDTQELLKTHLNGLIEKGAKSAEELVSFLETQAPLLCNEIITWGIIRQTPEVVVSLIFLTIAMFFHRKCKAQEWYYEGSDIPPGIFFTILLTLTGGAIFITELMDVVFPIVAPRLYLLETASHLIK
jgi:hypothetical protein